MDNPGTPVLTEQVTDGYGTYEQQWYCQPPAPGIAYRVTDCLWTPDRKIRRILAIQAGQGREKRANRTFRFFRASSPEDPHPPENPPRVPSGPVFRTEGDHSSRTEAAGYRG